MPRFVGPFSVPNPDGDDWDEMVRRNRLLQAANDPLFGAEDEGSSASDEFSSLNDPTLPMDDWQNLRLRQLNDVQGASSSGMGEDTLAGGDGDDRIQGGDGLDRVGNAAATALQSFSAKDASGRPLHPIGHPGLAESMVPIWGSGREGLAYLQEGHPFLAAANLGLAGAELFGIGEIGSDVAKLGLRLGKSQTWGAVRKAALKQGLIDPFQPGHHIIPRKVIPKWVPDSMTNNWINIKPMADEVIEGVQHTGAQVHRRLHGRAMVNGQWMPEFNWFQKLRYGAKPSGAAALLEAPASVASGAVNKAIDQSDQPN